METHGNRATLFDDGDELYRETLTRIRSAHRRVWVETFLFTPDETGRTILEAMSDAARRGCDVILQFDQLGSHVTNFGAYRPLEDAGGRVAIFNPLPPWRRLGRRFGSWLRYRDHRKIVVIDKVGYCGGHNFSQSYLGPPPQKYYDMTARLEGPAVRELARLFLDSFRQATGETRPLFGEPDHLEDGVPVRVAGLDVVRGDRGVVEEYSRLLDDARERALLLMSYFVPDEPLLEPLLAAARRGVGIDLLTTGATDVPVARWAGQHRYEPLLEAGIRIHELQEPRLHAKAMAVDGSRCMVGSFDVNTLERRNTAEAAVVLEDPALADAIESGFRACLPRSRAIDPGQWEGRSRLRRAGEWLAYRLMAWPSSADRGRSPLPVPGRTRV
jgi:cardiolipin synthase A/B